MGKYDHCCVGLCSNTRSRPELVKKRSHVDEMQWFSVTNEEKRRQWERQIRKGRADFNMTMTMKVCSNHFIDARPTPSNPVPVLFLTQSDYKANSPQKRSLPTKCETPISSKKKKTDCIEVRDKPTSTSSSETTIISLPLAFN
ncbi:hypothetical protein ElyMa_000619300 [Elysia marginata]|uniref:THAP-type domain-containing protein n=1 Tax=Elysia marginata TaxID=1093978 RepID=A0AAV4G927_9GAST|nr:hypothetical protein ElyMa_000619300 [Elysia marginata]